MTTFPKGISVGNTDTEVFVAVVGRGTFQNSQAFRSFAMKMIAERRFEFIIDLGQCAGMDSTFLGVLAGIGLRLKQNGVVGRVHIVNVNARNVELLQTLGLDRLFHVAGAWEQVSPHAPLSPGQMRPLPDSDPERITRKLDKTETASVMLDAHESLIQANKANEPKFRDITRLLREETSRSSKPEST